MRVVLRIASGPNEGHLIWLGVGQSLVVGRDESADFACPGDAAMAPQHFAIDVFADHCRMRSLDSGSPTMVNAQMVAWTPLRDGDQIVAGNTCFSVGVDGPVPLQDGEPAGAEPELPLQVVKQRLIDYLRQLPDPLWAILDGARTPMVLSLVRNYEHDCQSLYAGPQGELLAAVAPYLVALPPDAPILETIVAQGWGDSWGVFLTCARPFDEVRKHLRRFLQVQMPEGDQVYFRFYDPRVLRVFLPTCRLDESRQFFGPIQSFFVEDESPSRMLQFADSAHGARRLVHTFRESVSSIA